MRNDLNSSNLKEFWQSKHFAGTHINPQATHDFFSYLCKVLEVPFCPLSKFLGVRRFRISHTSSKPKMINKIFNSVDITLRSINASSSSLTFQQQNCRNEVKCSRFKCNLAYQLHNENKI